MIVWEKLLCLLPIIPNMFIIVILYAIHSRKNCKDHWKVDDNDKVRKHERACKETNYEGKKYDMDDHLPSYNI